MRGDNQLPNQSNSIDNIPNHFQSNSQVQQRDHMVARPSWNHPEYSEQYERSFDLHQSRGGYYEPWQSNKVDYYNNYYPNSNWNHRTAPQNSYINRWGPKHIPYTAKTNYGFEYYHEGGIEENNVERKNTFGVEWKHQHFQERESNIWTDRESEDQMKISCFQKDEVEDRMKPINTIRKQSLFEHHKIPIKKEKQWIGPTPSISSKTRPKRLKKKKKKPRNDSILETFNQREKKDFEKMKENIEQIVREKKMKGVDLSWISDQDFFIQCLEVDFVSSAKVRNETRELERTLTKGPLSLCQSQKDSESEEFFQKKELIKKEKFRSSSEKKHNRNQEWEKKKILK